MPVTPIQEADREEESPSSSLSKPLLDNDVGLTLEPEPHRQNGFAGASADVQQAQEVERQRFITTILINLSAIMERTDEQLLPAVYRFVGASFQVCQVTLASSDIDKQPAALAGHTSESLCSLMVSKPSLPHSSCACNWSRCLTKHDDANACCRRHPVSLGISRCQGRSCRHWCPLLAAFLVRHSIPLLGLSYHHLTHTFSLKHIMLGQC